MVRSILRFTSGCLIVAFLLAIALGAVAQTFEVTSTPVRVNRTLSQNSAADAYILTAREEQRVAYAMSVNTAAACAILVFMKGHDLGPRSQYFSTYSQMDCVPRYANTFPVDAADGNEFTVIIQTNSTVEVNYSLEINILSPVMPRSTAFLLMALTVGLLPPILWVVRRRVVAQETSMTDPWSPPPPTG